jgi:hypothetical protein
MAHRGKRSKGGSPRFHPTPNDAKGQEASNNLCREEDIPTQIKQPNRIDTI